MYRVTIYEYEEKTVFECEDEDEMRDHVETCIDDLESGSITAFVVSRVSDSIYKEPFWEKKHG